MGVHGAQGGDRGWAEIPPSKRSPAARDWIALWLGKVPQKRAGSDFPRVLSLVWEDPTRRRASND